MNNLVYFRAILVGSIIVIVSWAIEKNLVYLRSTYSLVRLLGNNLINF